ncbi:MAG: carboxypeptidase-like regulatory domain-containing protein, partial [Bacteroidota bacterium]
QGWKIKSQSLPAGAQGQNTLYIAFLFTSNYGNDCYLDFAHIIATNNPPPGMITVGTGSVSCNYPYTTYWGGGRTQLLYTAAQLTASGATPGTLTSIGFDVSSANTVVMNQFNVRIGNTTSSAITGWVTTGMQLCYSGTYAVPGTGWQMITLQTPFVWDGSNIIVEICYTNPSFSYYSYVNGTTAPTGQLFTYWMDNVTGCTYTGPSYTGYTGLPNLRFTEQAFAGNYSNVTLNVAMTCPSDNTTNTIFILKNTLYPEIVYQGTLLNASGNLVFPVVANGIYTLTVMKFGYGTYSQNPVLITGNTTLDVVLSEEKFPPSNLQVNDQSLYATWSPPRIVDPVFSEDWGSGSLAANGWTTSGGLNWVVYPYGGNAAPCVKYDGYPQDVDYDQYLTSKDIAGLHSPRLTLSFDMSKYNYGPSLGHTLQTELWNGLTWVVLRTFTSADPNGLWLGQSIDLSPYTNINFRIRFHASGPADMGSFAVWPLDNTHIEASDENNTANPCLTGYNFYVNNALSAFTEDTTYQIPAIQHVYGQSYEACVRAVYGTSESTQICTPYTSHFLCPPTDLSVTGIENAALPVGINRSAAILHVTLMTMARWTWHGHSMPE